MGLSEWLTDKDSVLSPEFFSETNAIELPELSWRDVESVAEDNDEGFSAQLPAIEETGEQQEQRTEAEREWLVRQRSYAELDEQLACVCVDESPFAVSPTMARQIKAFRAVVNVYCTMRNQSVVGIARYSGLAAATKKLYTPNRNDFYCDVELKARKALSPSLFRLFDKIILQELGERWAEVPAKVRTVIESRVGFAFDRAHLFPVARYFS